MRLDETLAGPSVEVSSPTEFIELNIDCLENLFDFLSVNDLFKLRQTCKRIKRIVDYFIRTYYPAYGVVSLIPKWFNKFRKVYATSFTHLMRRVHLSVNYKNARIQRIKDELHIVILKFVLPLLPGLRLLNCIGCHDGDGLFENVKNTIETQKIIASNNEVIIWIISQLPKLKRLEMCAGEEYIRKPYFVNLYTTEQGT